MQTRSSILLLIAIAAIMTAGVSESAAQPPIDGGPLVSADRYSFDDTVPPGVVPPRPIPDGMPPAPSPPAPADSLVAPMRPMAPLAPLSPVAADPSLAPPPSTLGHTYYRPSRHVPADEHPRVGMLDLTLPRELAGEQPPGVKVRVTVHDIAMQLEPLEGYVGDDRHWHFESEPLTPGVPHLYRVKVERVRYEQRQIRRYGRLLEQEAEIGAELVGVRYLRLIPGRIVTLEF